MLSGVSIDLAACDLSALPNKSHPKRNPRNRDVIGLNGQSPLFELPLGRLLRRLARLGPVTVTLLSRLAEVLMNNLHPRFCLQLQQKASEVDSSRVSGAIQNLINSWKASDTQADQDAATTSSQAPQPDEEDSAGKDVANSGLPNPPEQPGNAQPAEDEKQQEKRNRLLSLFSRGKNGQQQPEEMMPVRVSPAESRDASALTKVARICL